MKRFRHLFCRTYLWHVIDPSEYVWIIECTKCGYIKNLIEEDKMVKKTIETKEEQEKHLRNAGWLTTDEFMEKFIVSFKRYLQNDSYLTNDKDALHHPEDFFNCVSTYSEVALHIFGSFTNPAPSDEYL